MLTDEKFKKWVQKAFQGEKDYELIIHKNGGWKYYSENYSEELNSFAIAFAEAGSFRFTYEWDGDRNSNETIEQRPLVIVTKERKKMLIYDGKIVLAFGFPDIKSSIDKVIVLYQGKGVGTIAVASTELSEIAIVNYLQSKEHDILQDIIMELVHEAMLNRSMEGEENNAE